MKIAVTGGSGDLGKNLVPYLMEEGHSVVSIDRFLPPIPHPPLDKIPDYKVADVTNFGELSAALNGCDAIIHLAAHRSPLEQPHHVIFSDNVTGSYNVLYAAAMLGIKRVCLASSINAIGSAFSRSPQYDYFPLDEEHPYYPEDPYSLSKMVLENQADSFARRYEGMKIASLRFHWLLDSREHVAELTNEFGEVAIKHLWAYTLLDEASRSCLLSLTAEYEGHEKFYIVAPNTAVSESTESLIKEHYPIVEKRKAMDGTTGFFDCTKASRILAWEHQEN